MPAKAKKRRKKAASKQTATANHSIWIDFAIAAATGGLLGLSAPGFDQWYLVWIGLVPLLLFASSSTNPWQAFLRGLVFGWAYNLVYLNWYLSLYPLNWLGFNNWQGILLATAAWLIVSAHQAIIIGIFTALYRLLPLSGGFLPRQVEERWHLPALVTVPLLWVVVVNKLGNAHDALGVPWSMLEYSQYQILPLIQAASCIGGIGIGTLIVAVNVAVAGLIATVSKRLAWSALAAPTAEASARQALTVVLSVAVIYAAGFTSLTSTQQHPSCNLAVVQGNINIDMQKTEHRYTLSELFAQYTSMMDLCHPGLCIWTESALPSYLRNQNGTIANLAALAIQKKTDIVVGAMDRDDSDHPFNSAYGMSRAGRLLPDVYHKRYLVPFGEYTPWLVQYLPAWLQKLTNTPSGGGFAAGAAAVVLPLPCGKVAPLICFETLSPELVCSSVRAGGSLLVNISDLAWFHDSMIGRQMLAFSVLRAVENRRYFVFAANSGPSAIVDPQGCIRAASAAGSQKLLAGKVGFATDLSPFTLWYR